MTLNEQELRALAQISHSLERDDPELARHLRTMTDDHTTGRALIVLTATLIGLAVLTIGRGLNEEAVTATGILLTVCAPILTSIWFRRLTPS